MLTTIRPRSLIPIARLNSAARTRTDSSNPAEWNLPLDRSRPFICPTLTPLFYTPIFSDFTPEQSLRYNQLTAMSNVEVIAFFEESLAGTVLTALSKNPRTSAELRQTLAFFFDEEAHHTALFRQLNLLAAPNWYNTRHDYIVRFSPLVRRAIRFVGRRPTVFPFIFWIMLAMEEHSLEISRRFMAAPPDFIESHFTTVFRHHMKDEARHVQIDWHLIENFYARLPQPVRQLHARCFGFIMRHFLLAPKHAAQKVIELLAAEFPGLRPKLPLFRRELGTLDRNPDYHRMMYSPQATPIFFTLLNRFPEFRLPRQILMCYNPAEAVPAIPMEKDA